MAVIRLGRPRPYRPAAILVRHWAILCPGLLQKKQMTAPVPLKLLVLGPRGFTRNLYCGRPFFFRMALTSRTGPVEAASVWPSWFDSKFILRPSFLFQDGVDLAKLSGFVFVDLSDVLCVGFSFRGRYVCDVVPLSLLRSLIMLSISLASWADSSGSVGPSSRTLVRISSRRPPRNTVLSISHCIRLTPCSMISLHWAWVEPCRLPT